MAGSLANITLIGHAGRDPEMSYTPNGVAVTKFSLAVSIYKGKDSEGNVKTTTNWYNVTYWRQQAETVNSLVHKGAYVCVVGTLEARDYETKTGTKGVSLDVSPTQPITLLEKASPNGNAPTSGTSSIDPLGDLDDHPF